ncbi:MAG: AMP-binding protein [Desertimonas sp.]
MHPGVWAARDGSRPAVIVAGTGATVTYAELDARSNQLAHHLRAIGLRPGDHVAILVENHARFSELCWGPHRAGLYYTAISTRLAPAEAGYILGDSSARLLLTSKAMWNLAQEALATLDAPIDVLCLDADDPSMPSYDETMERYSTTPIADEIEGSDMLYSSGTTGRPKGVKLPLSGRPFGSLTDFEALLTESAGYGPDTVYLVSSPMYHASPLVTHILVQRQGGTIVMMDRFDAVDALNAIERFGVTHGFLVPTMFIRMLKLGADERARFDVSSLRLVQHAAAPCPVWAKEAMIDWWGPILWEGYSGTERFGSRHIDSQTWLQHKGSVGCEGYGIVHIVDDDGHELPAGTVGTIYFETPDTFEYHNDPEKTASKRDAHGWLTYGDVGYLDDEDYLFLTDRKDFMIIAGGVNIYPQEIENVLLMHPDVTDAAVFGVPNPDMGEEVKAVIQPALGTDAADLERQLAELCSTHLARYKHPRSIDFVTELPRHPTGKLYKRLLRDQYWADAESR